MGVSLANTLAPGVVQNREWTRIKMSEGTADGSAIALATADPSAVQVFLFQAYFVSIRVHSRFVRRTGLKSLQRFRLRASSHRDILLGEK
jgi:hypothetical protein